MEDAVGRQINVGDYVIAHVGGKHLVVGFISAVNSKMVTVNYFTVGKRGMNGPIIKRPSSNNRVYGTLTMVIPEDHHKVGKDLKSYYTETFNKSKKFQKASIKNLDTVLGDLI